MLEVLGDEYAQDSYSFTRQHDLSLRHPLRNYCPWANQLFKTSLGYSKLVKVKWKGKEEERKEEGEKKEF